jgi:hypothetical protein
MILCDEFVFIHQPKTGGTFVTEVLADFYARGAGGVFTNWYKHGGVEDIPLEYRSKPIVTTVRNPFDFYVSHFRFGWWIGRELDPKIFIFWREGEMRRLCPSYPYFSFEQFIEGALRFHHTQLLPEAMVEAAREFRLGPLTIAMLHFAVPGFEAVLTRFFNSGDTAELKRGIAKTRFLHTESLNAETYRWLLDLGVPAAEAGPIFFKGKVQPLNTPNGEILRRGHGQPRLKHWTSLFTLAAMETVVQSEWLFLELFPEYSWCADCVKFQPVASGESAEVLELALSGEGD